MKLKNLRALMLGLMGLALFSCEDNNNPIDNRIDQPNSTKTFELGAKLGEVAIVPVANSTNPKVSDDDLRATLHFKNAPKWATTSYKWNDFGAYDSGKINARWGALLGAAEQVDARSCNTPLETEPTSGAITANSIWFNMGSDESIDGQTLRMYCESGNVFGNNVSRFWMCLGGRPGSEANNDVNLSKQYFMLGEAKSDPNHLIAGLKYNQKQEGRHIPVMTDVRAYLDFQQKSDGSAPDATFSPRGSLIGIIIDNKLQREMRIESIIVRQGNNAMDFSGYFDFKVMKLGLQRATFTEQYPTGNTALIFPVKQDDNRVIAPNNDDSKPHNDNPSIFYIWGIQKKGKEGQPLRLQIRYRSDFDGDANKLLTTRTFRIYPGPSKAQATKFEEGKAYKTVLKITSIDQKGGSEGTKDWTEGDNINEGTTLNPLNPLTLVAKYDIAKVAEPIVGTSHELKFVTNHKIKLNEAGTAPETDYTKFVEGQDVGLYTWAEAMRLFGYDVADDTAPEYNQNATTDAERWTKTQAYDDMDKAQFNTRKYKTIAGQDYYIPNVKEITAIVPSQISQNISISLQNFDVVKKVRLFLVWFANDWDTYLTTSPNIKTIGKEANPSLDGQSKEGLEDVQIGDVILRKTDYTDEYLTKEVGAGTGNYVTYAIRFKGTKFESAWRYEYKKVPLSEGGNSLVIKNVMLTKNSGKTLTDGEHCVATEEFFTINNVTERVLSLSDYVHFKYNNGEINSTLFEENTKAFRWGRSIKTFVNSYVFYVNPKSFSVNHTPRNHGIPIRPFAKN